MGELQSELKVVVATTPAPLPTDPVPADTLAGNEFQPQDGREAPDVETVESRPRRLLCTGLQVGLRAGLAR